MRFTVGMAEMDQEAKDRVDRLVAYCKRKLRRLLDERGEVDARLLSEEEGMVGGYSYWRGVLSKADRSFAARKARDVEAALRMPKF